MRRALLMDLTGIVAAMAAVWVWGWGAVLPAVAVIGNRQHALAMLWHETAHRPSNVAMSWGLGWLFGAAYDGYRTFHLKHHKHLGTEDDPEVQYRRLMRVVGDYRLPVRLWQIVAHMLADLCGMGVVRTVSFDLGTFGYSRRRLLCGGGLLVTWGAIGGACWVAGLWWLPVLWWASLCSTFWCWFRLRAWAEHVGTDGTHRWRAPRWLAVIAFPHGADLHWEHHHAPSVPFHDLGRVRDSRQVMTLRELWAWYRRQA